VLSALFRAAIHAGKRAHTETAISRNAGSVSSVAARLAAERIDDIAEARIVVIGAGRAAELAVEALRHRDAKHITVVNRTRERAEELAARWRAEALGFDRISEALRAADIVVASTGAPHTILSRELVDEVMEARPDRPLILIDIAVPRDVDPGVSEVPNVHCYDIDDLETKLNDSMSERLEAVPQVEAIIEAEADEFMAYLRSLDMVPIVTALRAKADEIRRVETEKTLRHLSRLPEEDKARIEFLAKSVLDRFLHEPTIRLKAAKDSAQAAEYAAAVRYLFDLPGEKLDAD
jgi:glutamyl-tRNA reductase